MKKTTYILLGTLALLFIALILSPIMLNCIDNNDKELLSELNLDTKKTTNKNYTGIKAIKLVNNSINKRIIECSVNITPSDSNITSVTLPQAKDLTSSQKGDTLIISINVKLNKISRRFKDKAVVKIDIKTPQTLEYINANTNLIANLQDMKGDSISTITEYGCINLNKSSYRAVRVDGWAGKFSAEKSNIDSLYINSDSRMNWEISKCNINTEYITGSDWANYTFGEDECKKIVWTPKDDKARFTLKGNGKFIITPVK